MYRGIITPIVTPFNRDSMQSINYTATESLVESLISQGVSGIFALGSNGEFHVITFEEKVAFVKKVVEFVDKRVPVFAGSGACSTLEAVRLSKKMEEIGVDALSVISPYFIKPSDDELYQYFYEISKSVDIPIILYNIPKNTGTNLSKELVMELAKINNIVGIKDSSGDLENLKGYIDISKKYDFQVLVGSDSKISQGYRMGATGAIAGTSNLITKTLVDLDNALNEGKDTEAEKLQKDIDVLRTALKLGTVPSILKRSIELSGIAEVGPARKPVSETTSEVDNQIKEMLKFYHLTN